MPCLGLLSSLVGLLKDCNETQENYRLLGSVGGAIYPAIAGGGIVHALLDFGSIVSGAHLAQFLSTQDVQGTRTRLLPCMLER